MTATIVSPRRKLQLEIPWRGVYTGLTGEIALNSNAHKKKKKKTRGEYVALMKVTLVLVYSKIAQEEWSLKRH